MKSKVVTLEIECEVYYDVLRSVEGSDEDGNRGMISVEWAPRTVEVLTKVPKAVETWVKTEAIDAFNRKYN